MSVLYPTMELPDGTGLFVTNLPAVWVDRLISKWTGADQDHVAVVFSEDGVQHVYESTLPRSRRVTWEYYCGLVDKWYIKRHARQRCKGWDGDLFIELLEPKSDLPDLGAMKVGMDSRIGVRYSMVWNYLHDSPALHCSEYGHLAYVDAGVIELMPNPGKETPGSLMQKLQDTGLFNYAKYP